MRVQTTINLFLGALLAVKVQGDPELEACPRKEAPADVLALKLGSEVVLGCRGDVTVDGVLLAVFTKHKGRVRMKRVITPQRDGKYHSEGTNVTVHGTYQNVTTTGIYSKDKATASPLVTTENQLRTENIMPAISLPVQVKKVGGATEEGRAFGVITETGGEQYEEKRNVEYELNEDYSEEEEGLRVTRSVSRQARWTRDGQVVEKGGTLKLPALQLKDSGNYSCFRSGKLISSVKISVGVPPERPTLKCYKKFHTSKVRCEWISNQPIIPRPNCHLLLRKGWAELSQIACSYSTERSRCWCALPSEEGDRKVYVAKLCVANTVGSAVSDPLRYVPQNIIKPDPPARVAVREVAGQLQALHISWSYPASWRQGFYFLKFQLRYRPLQAREYQQVDLDGADLFWVILDAVPHTQYEIQLRAIDEYNGLWSDWTSPERARPWAAPEPTISSNIYTSGEPFWSFPEGSGEPETSGVDVDVGAAAHRDVVMWVCMLWVFGICVFITLTILSVYSIRMQLISKKNKQAFSPSCSRSTTHPPLLQQLMVAPQQQSEHHFLPVQEEEEGGIHLHNVDYFLSPGD
ncbi:interleukin-6 receptor subunit alpha [Brachyhypopomus gauderio]|uniref:interleukin-6 receptor subunit alpha n=1 Tax=Brachyhypopomus gauderio TaxID=698409 RepID=UPI004042AB41